MDSLLLDYYNYDSFYFPSENSSPIILYLNAFKEALFRNEGSIYDKALNLDLFCDESS